MQELVKFIRAIARLRLPLYAASICFFLVLSAFPGLLLVLWALRITHFSAMDLIGALETVVPAALMGTVERFIVTTYYEAGGAAVGISAAAALWSASRSLYGLTAGLDRVYQCQQARGGLRARLRSVLYLPALLPALSLTLAAHLFGRELAAEPQRYGISADTGLLLRQAVWLTARIGLLALLYAYLPSRRNGVLQSLPGAALTAFGWQALSRLFGVYAALERYSGIYGPVYTLALGMVWLYGCALILLLGGAVNRWLDW